jgi:ectoine hydroxylase-related dioxygenase (phytanoyl-CoA dioxygenase family)
MSLDYGWHQDYAFWQCTSPSLITAWIPLVDTTEENGCMRYIPGTQEKLIANTEKIVENQVVVPIKAGNIENMYVS